MKKLIIASTSTVHGKGYLEYILPQLKDFFKGVLLNEYIFTFITCLVFGLAFIGGFNLSAHQT